MNVHDFEKMLSDTFGQALQDQPIYKKRRASFTAVAALVLQVAQLFTVYLSNAPAWVAAVVGVIICLAEVVVQAGSKNGLGAYQYDQLTKAARDAGVAEEPYGAAIHTSTADLARTLETL